MEVESIDQAKPKAPTQRIDVPESDIKIIDDLDAKKSFKLVSHLHLATFIRAKNQPDDYVQYNPEQSDNGIEYFMDDEDHVWLEQVNNERKQSDGCDPVTHDQLEGIIDRLEKESIFETNSKNKRDLDDTEAVCCVCNDGEVFLFN